jgi:hypothetical protein
MQNCKSSSVTNSAYLSIRGETMMVGDPMVQQALLQVPSTTSTARTSSKIGAKADPQEEGGKTFCNRMLNIRGSYKVSSIVTQKRLGLKKEEHTHSDDSAVGVSPFEYLHDITFLSTVSSESEPFPVHIDWGSVRANKAALAQYESGGDSSSTGSIDSILVAKTRQTRRNVSN